MLQSNRVTVLDVFGSLFYAGAKSLEAQLPDPTGSTGSAVVLRLRGRTTITSTAIEVISGYARRLDDVGGRLFLSGVEPEVIKRLTPAGGVMAFGPTETVEALDLLGASTRNAIALAEAWVEEHGPASSPKGPHNEMTDPA